MRSRTNIAFAAALATLGAAFSASAQPIPPAPTAPPSPMPAQPPPGQYPQNQPPPGQYPQSQPPPSQVPQGQPPPGQYPQSQPPPGQAPQGQTMPGQYPQGQPISGQYQQPYPPQQGPAQGRANPSDGAIDTLDRPAPAAAAAAAESTSGPDLAWYKPISADTALEDRSRERFVTGLVNGHSFVTGPIRGTGSEVLATFNFNSIWGLGVGAYMPNGNFVVGADFFRYAGFNLPTGKRSFGLTVLVPTVEVRYVAGANVLYLGSGLTGLRVTACPFVIDLRLPNVTVWQPIAFSEASKPSLSVGASASFGFLF